MARTLFPHLILILSLLSPFTLSPATGKHNSSARHHNQTHFPRKLKTSHLRLFWQDIVAGRNASSITVVKPAPNVSNTSFGFINMIDNPLTLGVELNSAVMGKAQGFYASASKEQLALLMVMNFVLTAGKYNGSTLTIMGRNAVFDRVREMPVIGGSGLFRFATGYALARTRMFNNNTRDATVQYDVYVMHY